MKRRVYHFLIYDILSTLFFIQSRNLSVSVIFICLFLHCIAYGIGIGTFFFCHLLIFGYDKWKTQPLLGTQRLSLLSLSFEPCLFSLETGSSRIAARRLQKSPVHFSWALLANWIGHGIHGIHGIHGMARHRLPHLVHFDLHLFPPPLFAFSLSYCFSCFWDSGCFGPFTLGLGNIFFCS